MIPKFFYLFLLSFAFFRPCLSQEAKYEISEDLAYVLWSIMAAYEGEYDFNELWRTLENLKNNKIESKPLAECYKSLAICLEKKAEEKHLLNLQTANSYLEKVSTTTGFHEIIKGRLYYKVLCSGKGEVIDSSSPLLSYREQSLNERVLAENSKGVRLACSEMISGLRLGIEGMKLGEKREVIIHPELAYGEFPKPEPNSLIIIEVTLLAP